VLQLAQRLAQKKGNVLEHFERMLELDWERLMVIPMEKTKDVPLDIQVNRWVQLRDCLLAPMLEMTMVLVLAFRRRKLDQMLEKQLGSKLELRSE